MQIPVLPKINRKGEFDESLGLIGVSTFELGNNEWLPFGSPNRTWNEDLPLKLRRQKVKRMNFKDFKGLPNKIINRKFTGPISFKLPIKRLHRTDNKLTKHPFYNFGRKDGHV